VACLPPVVSLLLDTLFLQISGVSLALTWPHRLFYSEFSCAWATATAFPFPSTLEEVKLHQLLQASVFIYSWHGEWVFPLSYRVFLPPLLLQVFLLLFAGCVLLLLLVGVFVYSSCGKWVFPPLLWSFLPLAHLQVFLLLVAECVLPLLPSPAWLVYLQFWEGFPSPSLQRSGPFLLCVFIVVIDYYSVSLFFPSWGLVCPGVYADLAQGCLWQYLVPLSSPCGLCLPKPSGCQHLAVAQGPSWFLHLMWSGDALRMLEVWRGQSFASSQWFCL
jgi:hypothetical protein